MYVNNYHSARGILSKRFKMDISVETDIISYDIVHQCTQCGKVFSTNADLKRHSITHVLNRPYPCSHCGKAFKTSTGLKRHHMTHSGERPYVCKHCGKGFPSVGNLNKHQRVHTGERRFECRICGKTFTVKNNLVYHMRIHTGEKPYKCNLCGKAFAVPHHLKEHEQKHTGVKPFKCILCEKTFYTPYKLKVHMETHTGKKRPKSYKCNHCDKTFSNKRDCNKHQVLHSGEKPYKCSNCDKTFAVKSYLIDHMKRVHNWKKNNSSELQDSVTNTNVAHYGQSNIPDTAHELPNYLNCNQNDILNVNESVIFGMAYTAACMAETVKPNSFQKTMDQYFTANNLTKINHPTPDKDTIRFYSTKNISPNLDFNSNSPRKNTNSVES